ncbi:MAG: hypothetical protein KDB80_00200, partial [Planctomycetes bacterium]|nr:hypothetical protein [Planctomycetota bacterium]
MMQTVRTLASPEFGGRAAGSDGGRRTRQFLAAAFERIGLEPLAGDYEHPIRVPNPLPRRSSSATRVVGPSGVARLGLDAVPFRFSGAGRARGSVAFVGHGLVVPRLGLDDYAERVVDGCVVIALRGAPGWRDPDSPFRR